MTGEVLTPQEELANDLAGILYAKIEAATPVEVLSDRGDKLLRVVEGEDGERFVTRSFTPEAIENVERRYVTFREAWDGFQGAFTEAGIQVVRGHLIETGEDDFPFVAVHEYLEGVRTLRAASTEAKEATARSMGGMLTSDSPWLPTPQTMNKDMFGVTAGIDESSVQLVDTDPHVIGRLMIEGDSSRAWYLNQFAELFWDHWCKPEEREVVFGALVMSVSDVALDSEPLGETFNAFQTVHLMSNGVDSRG